MSGEAEAVQAEIDKLKRTLTELYEQGKLSKEAYEKAMKDLG